MRVLVIDEGRMEFRDVGDAITLEVLKGIVGGWIETVFTVQSVERHRSQLVGYANEEGLYIPACKPNVWMSPHERPIHGPIAIVGVDRKGETIELTPGEFAQVSLSRTGDARLPILQVRR